MREMKDSGIEWIGQIPKDWDVVPHKRVMHKVKKICEQYSGEDIISLTMNGVIKRDLTAGGKMPTSFDGYQYVKPNDLLLCLFDIDVTPRCVGVVKDYGVTSPAYSRFVMHDGYYNAYYDYLLRAIDDDKVFVHLSKNLRSSLTESDFGAIKTCVPSLAEQKRIVTFLDAQCAEIDTVLEKTRASIEEYKKLKQAVITQAVTKGIRGDRPMKDSGIEWIGDIPAEWEIKRIKNICSLKTGSTPSTGNAEWFNGDLLWFTPGDFNEKFVLLSSNRTLSRTAGKDGVATMIPANSVLVVCIGGSAGKVGYTNYGCSCNQQITALCKSNIMPKLLMYDVNAGMPFLRNTTMFTTLPILNNQAIGGLVLPIPREEEQLSIIEYLDEKCAGIDALIAKKQQYLTEIENYKKSLIYEYVTGKKEVKTSVLAD